MNPVRQAGPDGPPAGNSAAAPLLAEIADLAVSPVPEPVFLQELLKRAVQALGAAAGVIWMYDKERRLVLQCEVRLQSTGFIEDPELRAAFEQPFAQVLQTGGVLAHDAERATLHDGVRKCPALLGGLQREKEVSGLLQLFEGPAAPPEGRTERLRILEQICGLATRFWQRGLARVAQQEPAPGTPAAQQWTLSLYESMKSIDVAFVAANECRRLLSVDRVSIAERHGPHLKILAVSGQQSVNARSNVIRLLSQLTEQVLDTGEKLTFTGDTTNLPPQIERLLADYLHESRSRAVVILPVSGPEPREDHNSGAPEALGKAQSRPRPVGVIVAEQISEMPLPADLDDRLDRVAAHVGLAMRNAQARERIFLLPLWEFLGNWKDLLKGRLMAKIAAGLAGVLLVILALWLVPWDYRVVGKGRMMPIERRGIFAPWDGVVIDLPVKSGQQVEKGDVLVKLENKELAAKLLVQKNTLLEKEQERVTYVAQLSDPATAANEAQAIDLAGKYHKVKEEIIGTKAQVAILSQQLEALVVRAPIAGVVATFHIEELLRERPVRRGELLLEVMDPASTWRLEIDVPENRLGHILQAQKKGGEVRLPVRYVLATQTELTYDGLLDTISTRSAISETEGSIVPLYASLAEPAPPAPRIGAELTAKINCGPRSLGYVLFGDVVEFVRKRFWL